MLQQRQLSLLLLLFLSLFACSNQEDSRNTASLFDNLSPEEACQQLFKKDQIFGNQMLTVNAYLMEDDYFNYEFRKKQNSHLSFRLYCKESRRGSSFPLYLEREQAQKLLTHLLVQNIRIGRLESELDFGLEISLKIMPSGKVAEILSWKPSSGEKQDLSLIEPLSEEEKSIVDCGHFVTNSAETKQEYKLTGILSLRENQQLSLKCGVYSHLGRARNNQYHHSLNLSTAYQELITLLSQTDDQLISVQVSKNDDGDTTVLSWKQETRSYLDQEQLAKKPAQIASDRQSALEICRRIYLYPKQLQNQKITLLGRVALTDSFDALFSDEKANSFSIRFQCGAISKDNLSYSLELYASREEHSSLYQYILEENLQRGEEIPIWLTFARTAKIPDGDIGIVLDWKEYEALKPVEKRIPSPSHERCKHIEGNPTEFYGTDQTLEGSISALARDYSEPKLKFRFECGANDDQDRAWFTLYADETIATDLAEKLITHSKQQLPITLIAFIDTKGEWQLKSWTLTKSL